jgi:dinuclear metal center YbgI/SA1388 family protein
LKLLDLVHWLDEELGSDRIVDYRDAHNGLQVEGAQEVRSVALAVDASLATIRDAATLGANLLVVHHGLFWGGHVPVTGMYYRRLSSLIRSNLALYSSHVPLDVHPVLGNDVGLIASIDAKPGGTFPDDRGQVLGFWADMGIPRSELVTRLTESLRAEPRVLAKGPQIVGRIGVVTGSAAFALEAAIKVGCDTFLTGEGPHHLYFEAEERNVNVVLGGHYATERFGLLALGERLRRDLNLETFFLEHPTGL